MLDRGEDIRGNSFRLEISNVMDAETAGKTSSCTRLALIDFAHVRGHSAETGGDRRCSPSMVAVRMTRRTDYGGEGHAACERHFRGGGGGAAAGVAVDALKASTGRARALG